MEATFYRGKTGSKTMFSFVIIIFFMVIFSLIYLPAIRIDYLFMDDYAFVRTIFDEPKSFIDEIIDRSGEGKIIYGIFLHIISNNIDHAKSIRLIGIAGLSLLAFFIYIFLNRFQVHKKHAFLISILVGTFLPFQLFVAWLVTVPYIASALLSSSAGFISHKFVTEKDKRNTGQIFKSAFVAVFLLILSLHIYQPPAMIYWSVGIIPLLLLKKDDLKDRWYLPYVQYIAIGFIALAVYFLSIKALHFTLGVGFPGRGGLIGPTEVLSKLKWFFCCPLTYSLNLWNLFPTYQFASITGVIIITFLISNIITAYRSNKTRSFWHEIQRVTLIIGFLFLSYLPNLLVSDNVPAYRTLVALGMVICFLLYFGIMNLLNYFTFSPSVTPNFKDKIMTAILCISVFFSSYQAYNNVNDFAMLQADEYQYIKNAILSSDLSEITEIHVKRPDENKIIESGFLHDEFGRPTTSVRFGPPRVLKVILHDLGINNNIIISQDSSDKPAPEGKKVLVIDMTKFNSLSSSKSIIADAQRYCLTFPKRLR